MRTITRGVLSAACAASLLAAQAAAQQPAASQQAAADSKEVTISGCVQREADYRQSRGAGRGGVVGTGVGAGNEFILIEAAAGGATAAAPGGASLTGTTGTAAAAATAYELTGSGEGQLAQYVGQRVDITGRLKPAEVGAAGPTGGPTAGAPPRGVDVVGQDLKLRELEVVSVRPGTGSCPTSTQR